VLGTITLSAVRFRLAARALPVLAAAVLVAVALAGCSTETTSTVTTPAVTSTTFSTSTVTSPAVTSTTSTTSPGPTETRIVVTPESVVTTQDTTDGPLIRDATPLVTGGVAILLAVVPALVWLRRRPRLDVLPPGEGDDVVPGGDEWLYYVRLRITNRRYRRPAQDVEVVVTKLERKLPGGGMRALGPVTGRGLAWVHGAHGQKKDQAGLITIAPRAVRYLGLLACLGYDEHGSPLTIGSQANGAILWDPVLTAYPLPKDKRFHLGLPAAMRPGERAEHWRARQAAGARDPEDDTPAPDATGAESAAPADDPSAADDPRGEAGGIDDDPSPTVSESERLKAVKTALGEPECWTYALELMVTARDAPARRVGVTIEVPVGAVRCPEASGFWDGAGSSPAYVTVHQRPCRARRRAWAAAWRRRAKAQAWPETAKARTGVRAFAKRRGGARARRPGR
jgi:hypothetical protein